MSVIADAVAALEAAAKTVAGVEASTDLGANLNPPTVMIGPPQLTWDGYQVEPTEATFSVFVIVEFGEYAIEKLYKLVPQVAAALDANTDGSVISAAPAVFQSGGHDYPAYEISVEVPL